jgi:hypothetical protein
MTRTAATVVRAAIVTAILAVCSSVVLAMAATLAPTEQRELNRLLAKIILSKSNWPATV